MGDFVTYASTGVDYEAMDPFKREAQLAARETARNLISLGLKEDESSRGESVYLIEAAAAYFAHVEEGLGTKNLVADAMYTLTGKSYYDHIGQDGVAMIVNDMVTLGAQPLSAAMHLAVGSGSWFDDAKRASDLIRGWKEACDLAGCSWGCGETPTLKDLINPASCALSGSAFGLISPKSRKITGNIQDGDAIVAFESSGIHANGLTLARKIADKLPDGYLTRLPDGRTYGETLLDPTHIYVEAVQRCLDAGIDIHYTVNVTGHGWRKLMRSNEAFTYVVEYLPWRRPAIFDFLQEHGPVDDQEAFGNLNMGIGFILYVPRRQVHDVFRALGPLQGRRTRNYFLADVIGHVEKSAEKKVIIQPKGLEFLGATLAVR